MKNGICYVVGAGENYGLSFTPTPDDYVIAADGGLYYLEQEKIRVNLVIGDFDSLHSCPVHEHVIKLSPEKDDTDMLAAVKEGMRVGYKTFHIYCGTGGRMDHTMANIQLLAFLAEEGMQGLLFDKDAAVTVITNITLELPKAEQGYLSVFSYSEKAEGVYLRGLKYELNNAQLKNTFPMGVSNEFIGRKSSVTVKDGTLLIFLPIQLAETLK